MTTIIQGRVVIPGQAAGRALVANEPLSFWGGYDYHTGEIIDRRHPLSGQIAAGRILCLPFTRGSSTTTAVLLEAIKAGTAPAAILTTGVDTFFALASIVADAMYGRPMPVLALTPADFAQLRTGDWIVVNEQGQLKHSHPTPHSSSEVFRDLEGLAARRPIQVEACIEAAHEDRVRAEGHAAYLGGAATVELCSAMHLDGLTPDAGHIRAAREAFGHRPGLMVMVRPRAGDFCYSPAEVDQMLRQVETAAACGADGVVFGVLRSQDQRIAVDPTRTLLNTARDAGLKATFHRAFDATPDADEALATLIGLGVDRVLTCGIPWGVKGTALDGVERLAATIRRSQGRIEIVLAGGIRPANVGQVLARLPLADSLVSVHAYSGAQANGQTTVDSVRALVEASNSFLYAIQVQTWNPE